MTDETSPVSGDVQPAAAPVGYTTVSSAKLTDASGNPISNATVSFQPCDSHGNWLSYQVNGSGQALWKAITTQVSSGAFSVVLADTTLTQPTNICYQVTVIDNVSNQQLLGPGYFIQPFGSTWNFDTFVPNVAALALIQTGPQGPPVNFRGAWSSSTTYAAGDAVSYTDGSSYISMTAGNLNHVPPSSPTQWGLLAQSAQLSSATPLALGTAAAGTSTLAAHGDHVHPNAVTTGFSVSGGSGLQVTGGGLSVTGGETADTLHVTGTSALDGLISLTAGANNILPLQGPVGNDLSGVALAICDEDDRQMLSVSPSGIVTLNVPVLNAPTLNNATINGPGSQVIDESDFYHNRINDLSGYGLTIEDEDGRILAAWDKNGIAVNLGVSAGVIVEVVDASAYVAWTNVVSGATQIYVEDKATNTKTLVPASGSSTNIKPSADGQKVIFRNTATSAVNQSLYYDTVAKAVYPTFPNQILECWGDSLTAGTGASYQPGTSYPPVLAGLTGLSFYSRGVGGNTSTQIAARFGAYPVNVTLSGGQIPSGSTAAISCTLSIDVFGNGWSYNTQPGVGLLYGWLSGVHGTLTATAAATYVFTPSAAPASTVTVPAGTQFIVDTGGWDSSIQLLWSGQNGPTAPSSIQSDIAASVAFLKALNKRYLILGNMYTDTTYNMQKQNWPGHFCDVRAALLLAGNGVAWDGVSWPNPLTDQTSPYYIPSQYRYDSVHLNDAGYNIVAQTANTSIRQRNWI